MIVDDIDRLSHMVSSVKAYLEERYPRGYSIETQTEFTPCHVRFAVKSPGGERGPILVLPGDFVEHGDAVQRELDSRDVMGAMARAGRGRVVVPKFGPVVVEPE